MKSKLVRKYRLLSHIFSFRPFFSSSIENASFLTSSILLYFSFTSAENHERKIEEVEKQQRDFTAQIARVKKALLEKAENAARLKREMALQARRDAEKERLERLVRPRKQNVKNVSPSKTAAVTVGRGVASKMQHPKVPNPFNISNASVSSLIPGKANMKNIKPPFATRREFESFRTVKKPWSPLAQRHQDEKTRSTRKRPN